MWRSWKGNGVKERLVCIGARSKRSKEEMRGEKRRGEVRRGERGSRAGGAKGRGGRPGASTEEIV